MDNLELDLHGKTWAEALEEFVDAYNRAVQPGGHACRTLTVIHGYGASGNGGVLRTRFRKFFEKHESLMEFTPGEKVSVTNPGYTLVTPKHTPFPEATPPCRNWSGTTANSRSRWAGSWGSSGGTARPAYSRPSARWRAGSGCAKW